MDNIKLGNLSISANGITSVKELRGNTTFDTYKSKPRIYNVTVSNIMISLYDIFTDISEDKLTDDFIEDTIVNVYKDYYTLDQIYSQVATVKAGVYTIIKNSIAIMADVYYFWKTQDFSESEITIDGNPKFRRFHDWTDRQLSTGQIDIKDSYVVSDNNNGYGARPSNAVYAQKLLRHLCAVRLSKDTASLCRSLFGYDIVCRRQTLNDPSIRLINLIPSIDGVNPSVIHISNFDTFTNEVKALADANKQLLATIPYLSQVLAILGLDFAPAISIYSEDRGWDIKVQDGFDATRQIYGNKMHFIYDDSDIFYNTFAKLAAAPYNHNDVFKEDELFFYQLDQELDTDVTLSVFMNDIIQDAMQYTMPLEVVKYPSSLFLGLRGNIKFLNITTQETFIPVNDGVNATPSPEYHILGLAPEIYDLNTVTDVNAIKLTDDLALIDVAGLLESIFNTIPLFASHNAIMCKLSMPTTNVRLTYDITIDSDLEDFDPTNLYYYVDDLAKTYTAYLDIDDQVLKSDVLSYTIARANVETWLNINNKVSGNPEVKPDDK